MLPKLVFRGWRIVQAGYRLKVFEQLEGLAGRPSEKGNPDPAEQIRVIHNTRLEADVFGFEIFVGIIYVIHLNRDMVYNACEPLCGPGDVLWLKQLNYTGPLPNNGELEAGLKLGLVNEFESEDFSIEFDGLLIVFCVDTDMRKAFDAWRVRIGGQC